MLKAWKLLNLQFLLQYIWIPGKNKQLQNSA